MSIGPFFVGQRPLYPASIRVNGPYDFDDYAIGAVLIPPDGSDAIDCSATPSGDDTVLVEWPGEFEMAGMYLIQVVLTAADALDLTTTAQVEVRAALPSTDDAPLVDPDKVFAITNTAVTAQQIIAAQYTISAFVGLDLAVSWASLSDRSRYWFEMAICHQSTWREQVSMTSVGAQKIRAGSVEITYRDGGASDEAVMLHPMARICLSRISARTMYSRPFIAAYREPIRPMWEAVS